MFAFCVYSSNSLRCGVFYRAISNIFVYIDMYLCTSMYIIILY